MKPWMTDAEIAFLASHLRPTDRVFEWGSGNSTRWLAARCGYVMTVEHQVEYARAMLGDIPRNVALAFIPPNRPYLEGTDDDGDENTFHDYVRAFHGGVDVVLIDGRARVSAARYVAVLVQERLFQPPRDVFLHDCQRPSYAPIWNEYLHEVNRVGNLMLLARRFG